MDLGGNEYVLASILFVCVSLIAALTVEFPFGRPEVTVCVCVCVKFSHTVNTAVPSAGNPFATSHSPCSVSERAVPAPSP